MTFCADRSSVQSTNAVSPLSSIQSILLHYSALFNVPLGVLELIFGDVCRQIDEALYNQPLAQLDTDIRFKVHLYRVLEGVLAKRPPDRAPSTCEALYQWGRHSRIYYFLRQLRRGYGC